jgi:hypothetical protein
MFEIRLNAVRLATQVFGVLLLSSVIGCGYQKTERSISRENSHLRWLIRLYVQAGQQGHQPKNEQDLKQYIASMPADSRNRVLTTAGVRSTDELFVSERDKLPYVVIYGASPKGVAGVVIAFEQMGLDGQRYVGFSSGVVEIADQQRFEALVPSGAIGPN